jgi:hypothetical protein
MQKFCPDSRKVGATPRLVLRQSQRPDYNLSHFGSSLSNSRRSRLLALNLREVVLHRSRLKCPLIPIPDLRSIKRVLETITIGRWLSIQCMSNPLNDGEPLTFDLFYRREAPAQALASSFFSGATGTIFSAPAHFASTSGPQFAVHIHRTSWQLEYNLHLMRIKSIEPANFMNTGEQLNPTVRTESQTFQGFLD